MFEPATGFPVTGLFMLTCSFLPFLAAPTHNHPELSSPALPFRSLKDTDGPQLTTPALL